MSTVMVIKYKHIFLFKTAIANRAKLVAGKETIQNNTEC